MKQYIDKYALVAELESKKNYAQTLGDNAINGSMQQFYDGMREGCVETLSFINSLKVKEVDLDFQRFAKEMEAVFSLPCSETENTEENPMNWEFAIAKHFFELGLKYGNKL